RSLMTGDEPVVPSSLVAAFLHHTECEFHSGGDGLCIVITPEECDFVGCAEDDDATGKSIRQNSPEGVVELVRFDLSLDEFIGDFLTGLSGFHIDIVLRHQSLSLEESRLCLG